MIVFGIVMLLLGASAWWLMRQGAQEQKAQDQAAQAHVEVQNAKSVSDYEARVARSEQLLANDRADLASASPAALDSLADRLLNDAGSDSGSATSATDGKAHPS